MDDTAHTDASVDTPALHAIVAQLRDDATAFLLQAIELNRTDGFDARREAVDMLRLIEEAETELAHIGDCGAEPGECVCRCHLRH